MNNFNIDFDKLKKFATQSITNETLASRQTLKNKTETAR